MFSLRFLPATIALLLGCLSLQAQQLGITNGFPYTINPSDTSHSPYLPSLPTGEAGAHGFVKAASDGSLIFADGAPARFFGVTIQWTACFPDSMAAILTAAHLRKLGVNLVRFQYMDNSYDWGQDASFLDQATGFRSIHEMQMRRFDWFFYQLKKNGIYSCLLLQSARAPRAEDGLGTDADSMLWVGRGMYHLYPQARAAHKREAELLLDHVNPFTSMAYKSEPAVAMIETMDQGSIISLWYQNVVNYVPGQTGFSWHQSRRLDSMYTAFLKSKYGSTSALATAWSVTPPTGGFPNLITEGSFEGSFEQAWSINSYDATTLTRILTTDSVPDGKYALTLRVGGTNGNIYTGYILQPIAVKFNTLYRLSFKAKCSNPNGRTILLANSTSDADGLSGGLYTTINVTPYWKEQEAYFLVPVQSATPLILGMYFGDVNGELSIDDVQLREVAPSGLQAGEMLENASVIRIPRRNVANYLLSSKRIEDQSDFYLSLDRDYFDEMRSYVADTLRALQMLTGAANYWASGLMEASIQGRMDFTTVQSGWDWISNDSTGWMLRNYSPLRATYAGPAYDIATFAHARQPLVAAFQQPYPNRYQSESMLFLPAYALLQRWDGLLWDSYSDDRRDIGARGIDSAAFSKFIANPAVISLMPAVSQIFRNGLLAPAQTTIDIRHSTQQTRLVPRLESQWGRYAIPGGMPGYAMASDRIVIDSLDAEYITQRNDISFPATADGEVRSDTREIFWEYADGVLSLNSPYAQGASGFLARSAGASLDFLNIDLLSNNETATVLWVPLDTTKPLYQATKSFIVIDSRTEPTGMQWRDSMHVNKWGKAPMLVDPVKVRLTFKRIAYPDASLILRPLDSAGRPIGAPIVAVNNGGEFTATIDQSQTHAMWYAVEMKVGLDVPSIGSDADHLSITPLPSTIKDRGSIRITLPASCHDAQVELFDALGQQRATLRSGPMERGTELIQLDASTLPAGTYFIRLRTESGESTSMRVTVVR